ncbi:MAG TPA: MFS transporter [Chthonomonadaceae bacterium]|nr:MFS transporter [Chthonomonadaceae bacterium]
MADSADGRDPRMVRWNLGALMLDVTCFSVGMAFLDLSAVLPLLLERLGATGVLIGAFAALRTLSFNAVQVFVAYAAHGLPRQKPILAWIAGLTRLPLLILPFFLWHAADSELSRLFALLATFLILSVWALGDGLGYVPWMEIVARAFPARTRGRFFAATQLASGLAGIGIAALIVRNILASPRLPYPHNYALLAGIFALMMQISMVGVLLIREPPAPDLAPPRRPPLSDYFRRLPALIRANPTFMRLALIQLLVGFGSASAPFYVLYALSRFRLDDAWGGTYQVMQAVGIVALMPVWTYLSEKRSPAAAVRGLALACLLSPVLAMTVGTLHPLLFGLVFLLMGGSLGWGMWIVMNHFLLSHITEDERPIFVALLNLLFAPSALYPFFGGLLVQQKQFLSVSGVPVLFLLTSLVIAVGFALALRLPAPDAQT